MKAKILNSTRQNVRSQSFTTQMRRYNAAVSNHHELDKQKETAVEKSRYEFVTTHQICNLPAKIMATSLECGFTSRNKFNAIQKKVSKLTSFFHLATLSCFVCRVLRSR
jgi:hypothetical protein